MKGILARWSQWARLVKRDAHALYLASHDPRVPWYAKAIAICVAGYALSPIDLIPDFIPILGYVDDLIIVPAGIALVISLIPTEIVEEHRAVAATAQDRPVNRTAGIIISAIWILSVCAVVWVIFVYVSAHLESPIFK